jgi:hypothetical protein
MLVRTLLVCLLATNALAWGNSGHRITARLAQDRLSDDAEAAMRQILGQRWMSDVASLPDDWRNNAGAAITGGWHFVNTPIDEESYAEGRDCPQMQCVVEQIEAMISILEDEKQSSSARREALIYLVHFVGDIHQPFHAGSGTVNGQSDRGGNAIDVTFQGQQRNLHSVWDSGLISSTGLNVADYTNHLKDEIVPELDENAAAGGTPADWANESHEIAQAQRVEPGTTLSDEYIESGVAIVDQRLARGALRLARVIEDALGGEN